MDLLFIPLKFLLIGIDLFITLVTFGWIDALKKYLDPSEPLRSVPVADDESHRVDPNYKGKLVTTPQNGLKTLYALAADSFKKYGDVRCMGDRKFLGWKSKTVKHFGDNVEWLTFQEAGEKSTKFGAALRKTGLISAPSTTGLEKVTTNCRMAIFENTCPEWLLSAIGAFSQSVTVVTIYATLGLDAVVEAINDSAISVIVCNRADIPKLLDRKDKMPSLKTIIYTNNLVSPDDQKKEVPAAPAGVTIVSFDDFVASGDTTAFPPTPPEPRTCAVVMYTSGSTGKPKGVLITHEQVAAAVGAGEFCLGIRKGEDVYLAYLPLAHIMEMMAEFSMISMGCTLCYADPKSLTTTGAYPIGALEQYSPTLMVAVPKIWDVIKKGVLAKVGQSSPVAQFLVKTALEARGFAIKNGYDTPLFNALVFKKFKKVVGGRLRFAISGGGPLNGEVQDFIRTCFGVDLVQGYGLTETCAGLTIQAADDFRHSVQGVPIPSAEVKLESTPDVRDKAGQAYLSTDRRDVEGNPVFGRGEILIKGGNVTAGYYMMADKTKEVYESNGWFHTGDIGQFMSDGSIRIVDRKKNLVKLKGGEYIALEKMEMTYGNSEFVDAVAGGICCYGDGEMDRPIALMQLNEAVTMKWAKENGVDGDFAKVKETKELTDAVMKSMEFEHGKSDLSHLEKLVAVALLNSPWTPENQCLTAANKINRNQLVQTFGKEFEEARKKGIR